MITELQTIDLSNLISTYKILENKIHWIKAGTKGLQTGLQYKLGDDPWTSAVGNRRYNEFECSKLNPFFKDTEFEEIITKFKLSRTRLMWINPYSCYSLHRDENPRIHIPLITNSECYFVFSEDTDQSSIIHLSAGRIYWVDTRKRHTFMNCSSFDRLHLVGVVEN